MPVNYALAGETIVIRTAPNTEIARFAPGQTVAFETDQVDEFLQTGWSVLAVGKLNLVSRNRSACWPPSRCLIRGRRGLDRCSCNSEPTS